MKKLTIHLMIILFAISGLMNNVLAQAPEGIIYQAEARDEKGDLIKKETLDVLIKIIQDDASGPLVWEGLHELTTSGFGIFVLVIGHGTNTSGFVFEDIDWGNHPHFLNVQVKTKKTSAWIDMGTSQLLSVPYALHAKTAEAVTGTITETDPIFGASVASGITGTDATNWNNKQDQLIAGANISIEGNTISATSSGFTHYVGELYGGGIVITVWKESGVEKGLIASLTDVGANVQWSSITGTLGATAQSPIDGQTNTTAIVSQGDDSGAAYLCANYSAGGFNDWYLPAAWELNQCYNAAFVVNTILGDNGFQWAYYWSSTEDSGNTAAAWGQNFNYGNADHSNKNEFEGYRVRAVRRF